MATNDFTATTPEELAKQFPITGRPFAIWYNAEPEAVNNRPWAVNDESGEASQEFDDLATALKAAAEMGKEWADEARRQAQALAKVNEHDNTENLTAADLEAINNRLYRVVISLLAIKELAISALEDSELSQHWIFAIEEMALSNVRGIDACIQRMGGTHLLQEIPEFKS